MVTRRFIRFSSSHPVGISSSSRADRSGRTVRATSVAAAPSVAKMSGMNDHLSRRTMLRGATAAACALALRKSDAQPATLDKTNLPYIDAHSHVWSPDVERWPLANKQTREALKPLSFTPEELLKL